MRSSVEGAPSTDISPSQTMREGRDHASSLPPAHMVCTKPAWEVSKRASHFLRPGRDDTSFDPYCARRSLDFGRGCWFASALAWVLFANCCASDIGAIRCE